ncbi:hypothetical protein N7510_001654 [Penicillium lagena]|uniref:uncharacterized protein n=1 Tax=Penicillium lagena TaxID=94218 RepID=UPI002540BF85|nr:uncharacterized protein N7510_001654 [Penicillium lagena]KAJ5625345.1 hypothetical protein N7510_001654 [Penicillium lagena]
MSETSTMYVLFPILNLGICVNMRRHRLPKKGKKACTECRQQKAKCDVYVNHPCSRCRKMQAECVISDPFKREHKRKRLSELEKESEELRRKLRASQSAESPNPSPIALLTAAAEMGVREGPSAGGGDLHIPVSQVAAAPVYPLTTSGPAPGWTEGNTTDITKSRSVNGNWVTGEEIDDLFRLFFCHYAHFIPILDPETRPNTYYAQSPFLFWAVIGVSCRNYSRNPTLLMALAQSITEMAFLSGVSLSPPWHTIQGLLLLLTWPLPKGHRPDVTFALSGLLLHIAMQNGLHIPMSSHEFSRVKISAAPSETDMVRRAELWAHCVVVYQRACVIKGQSPRLLVNLAQDPAQRQLLFDKVASPLVLKLRCQELMARCSQAVQENGVRTMSVDQERALDILLRTYESQVDELELQAVTDDERYHAVLCRMVIQIFHFFKTQTLLSSGCFPRLLATACHMIDLIQSITSRLNSPSIAPVQLGFGLLLSSVALLRILKSSTCQVLDTGRARTSFFTAINLAKQMSVEHTDMAAKTVTILNALWNSSKAFRKADGSEYPGLRIRSRLAISAVVDAVWWFRDEFDPHSRSVVLAHAEPGDGTVLPRARSGTGTNEAESIGVDPNRDASSSALPSAGASTDRQESFLLDENFLADFEWALGDDALFSMDLVSTWPSTTNLL